jgi:hypothetical protein
MSVAIKISLLVSDAVLLIQDISTMRKETLGSTETIKTTKLHGVTYWKNKILIRQYCLFNARTSTLPATADRRVARQQPRLFRRSSATPHAI